MFLVLSCDNPEGDEGSGGGGDGEIDSLSYGQVNIVSSTLAVDTSGSLYLQDGEDIEDCDFSMDIYRAEGSCFTPYSVIGYATVITGADATSTEVGSAARLAGVPGTGYDPTFDEEEGALISGAEIDFAVDQPFTGFNEIFQQYETKPLYTHISMGTAYQKIGFSLKDKFVTMLIPAFSQPVVDWSAWDNCPLSEEEKEYDRFQNANVLEGMTFEAGDYLFCVKDAQTDSCEADDFQWYDMDDETLVSTRPDNPRKHSYLTFNKSDCIDEGEGRKNLNMTMMFFPAVLTNKFRLYSDYSHGINSVQWPDAIEPFGEAIPAGDRTTDEFAETYQLYYYHPEDGEITEGTNLALDFDFDVSEMLYLDGVRSSDIAASSLQELLKIVYTKHDWVFQQKGDNKVIGYSIDQVTSMGVEVEVTLTGDRNPPDVPEYIESLQEEDETE